MPINPNFWLSWRQILSSIADVETRLQRALNRAHNLKNQSQAQEVPCEQAVRRLVELRTFQTTHRMDYESIALVGNARRQTTILEELIELDDAIMQQFDLCNRLVYRLTDTNRNWREEMEEIRRLEDELEQLYRLMYI
jgi:hypothetical protein